MGIVNSVLNQVEERQRNAAIKQQLLQFKKMKRRRDMEMASRMAMMRDRVNWLCGFYAIMGGVSFGRMIRLRRISPLPLNYIPFVLVPFLVAYQADFAYGNKADRIEREARKILKEENHWFCQPMDLPPTLKEHYLELWQETNEKLVSKGYPPEKHWGRFSEPETIVVQEQKKS